MKTDEAVSKEGEKKHLAQKHKRQDPDARSEPSPKLRQAKLGQLFQPRTTRTYLFFISKNIYFLTIIFQSDNENCLVFSRINECFSVLIEKKYFKKYI